MALGKLKSLQRKASRLDDAARVFGSELARGIKEEANTPGSSGQRFLDSPLGQYYLPKRVRQVGSFIAPSPRKVGRDTKNVLRNPSPGNVAAETGNVLSIATLPLAASGAVRGATGAARGGRVLTRAGGLPLGERIGLAARSAVSKDAVYHGTTIEGAKGIRALGFKGKPFATISGTGPDVAYVTKDPVVAARYAARAKNLKGGSGARVVASKIRPGAKAAGKGLGGEAFDVSDLVPMGEKGMLQFPRRGGEKGAISRIKARLMNAMEESRQRTMLTAERERELLDKIAKTKEEIGQLGRIAREETTRPSSLRNLSNIRDKSPKGRGLPPGLKDRERGALDLSKWRGASPNARRLAAAEAKAQGFSQAAIARATGVTPPRVQQWLREGKFSGEAPESYLKRLKRLVQSERGSLGGADDVVRRANARLRGLKFKQELGESSPLRQADIRNRLREAEGRGHLLFGVDAETRSAGQSLYIKMTKMVPLRTHYKRLPRN